MIDPTRFSSKIRCGLVFGLVLVSCTSASGPGQFRTDPQLNGGPTETKDSSAAGNLDPTFGHGGIVITNPLYARPSALAIQANGKIVLAGPAQSSLFTNQHSEGVVLDRYDLDGSPDITFGKDGEFTSPPSTEMTVGAVAIQSDGKIIVAGSIRDDAPGWDDFALVRYNANGSLDATFGKLGVSVTDLSGGNDWAQAIAIQDDGRIIVGGRTTGAPQHPDTLALTRYNADGVLDSTFGTGGVVFVEMNRFGDARSVVIQADGKIVVVGSGNSQVRMFDFAVLRFDVDGELDSTFGSDGIVLTDLGGSATAMAAAIQPDGKIVAAGQGNYKNHSGFVVARYNTDGTLDPTFAEAGLAISNLEGEGWARGVAISPDGKIVAAGGTGKGLYSSVIAVLRFDMNGFPDRAFGRGGQTITPIDGAVPTAMGLEPDGKIVVAGYAINYITPPLPMPMSTNRESSWLARYLP